MFLPNTNRKLKNQTGPVNAVPYRGNTKYSLRLQVRFSDLRHTSRPLPALPADCSKMLPQRLVSTVGQYLSDFRLMPERHLQRRDRLGFSPSSLTPAVRFLKSQRTSSDYHYRPDGTSEKNIIFEFSANVILLRILRKPIDQDTV